ncbi:MAG: hypothetical protein RL108_112 [Bacteroidota bacterium]|jgi:hypothetical protein
MELSDLGPNSAVIRYNKCFGSKIPNKEEINKFIGENVELLRNQLATLNAGEIKYVRGLWSEVSTRSKKVKFAGSHLITFLDFTSSNDQTPFTFNALALKAFMRYFLAIETIITTVGDNSNQEALIIKPKGVRTSKIKGVTIAAFYRSLSHSKIYPILKDERVKDYCYRVNEIFNLPIHTRIETDFGKNEDRIDSIKSEILPTIKNTELKKVLEEYFDEIQP